MKHFLTYSLAAASLLSVSSLVAAKADTPSIALTGKGAIAKTWKAKSGKKSSAAKHVVGDVNASEEGFLLTSIFEEDFSNITAGSEETPETAFLNDNEGSLEDSYFHSTGWSGIGVHQAGGCLYLEPQTIDGDDFYGMLASPVFDASSSVKITMRVRAKSSCAVNVQIQDETDDYGMDGWQFYINEEWQQITWIPGYTGSLCHIYIFPQDEDGVMYVDDIKIEKLEATGYPEIYEETNVTGNSFDINFGGDFSYYDLEGYVTHTAKATEEYTVMDADFSTIDRDGTIDYPDFDEDYDWLYPDLNEYSDFTGWTLLYPKYIEGGICLDGEWSEDGDYSAIVSPVMNLSHNGGKINLSMTSMGFEGDRFNIQVLSLEDGQWVRAYSKGFDVTKAWNTLDLELTGGAEQSVIQIIYGGTAVMALQNLKVSQTLNAGDQITLPLFEDGMSPSYGDDDDDDWWDEDDDWWGEDDEDWARRRDVKRAEAGEDDWGEDDWEDEDEEEEGSGVLTYSVSIPDRFANELYSYSISGERIYYFYPDNSDDWGYSRFISGGWTDLRYVGDTSSVKSVVNSNVKVYKNGDAISIINPDKVEVSVYNLNGFKITSSRAERASINVPAGVYVINAGGKVFKISK
jgi:hypothetical protein